MCSLSQYKHQQNRRLLLPIPMDHCHGHNCIVLNLQVYSENACMHVMGSIVYITWCKTVLENSLVECWLSNVLDVYKCSLSDSTFTCNEMRTCSWCQYIYAMLSYMKGENVYGANVLYILCFHSCNLKMFGCQCVYIYVHSCSVKLWVPVYIYHSLMQCESVWMRVYIQNYSVMRCEKIYVAWFIIHAVWSVRTWLHLDDIMCSEMRNSCCARGCYAVKQSLIIDRYHRWNISLYILLSCESA